VKRKMPSKGVEPRVLKSAPDKGARDARAAAHFTPAGLQFLRGLARNNDREWFNQRKPVYEAEVKRPMLAVIDAVTQAMAEFAPAHMRAPEKIMMRIYRDTRFAKEKHPYKPHASAWWVRNGLTKTSGAGFYLQVSSAGVQIAAGAYRPTPEQLLAMRRFLLEHAEEYRKLGRARALRELFTEFDGNPLSRSPKGFPAEHPAAPLFRQRQWGFSAHLPAETALDPGLAATVVKHFRAAAPLMELLNRPLAVERTRPRRALF
jgi:uncharacterized protein (TIGR02453 family)